jgi:apolipoprotein N-acyltransferase
MVAFNRMNKILVFFKSISYFLALPLLSGIMVGTSYIPFYGWALLFCYIPLWFKTMELLRDNKKISQIFLCAWFTQFVLTLIGFNWIYYVSREFGNLPVVLSFAALIGFAAFMHLYIAIAVTAAAVLIRKLRIQNKLIQFLVIALSMSLAERVWPSIFEWNLGYSLLWMELPLFQWADTVGFWGLSTWIFIAQAFIAYAVYLFINKEKKPAFILLGQTVAVLLMLNATGYFKGLYWSKTDDVTRVAVTQGNIGNAEKLQSEKRSEFHAYIIGAYSDKTTAHLQKSPADFIIWPETALPMALDKKYLHGKNQRKVLSLVQDWGIPLVTGGYSVSENEQDDNGDDIIRNAVFYISPKRDFSAPPYFKTNLLAFGEYMPLGDVFPFLYKLLPFVGTYAEGSGPVIAKIQLKDKVLRLGPQICYDSLYPNFSRELSKNGAQIIYNVTNDAWFGWWAEPFQHQYMTLGRAVEVRRPLVRSTNTGFSSAILADGTVLTISPINEAWAHTFEIKHKKNAPLTLFTKFGYLDWIIWLLLLAVLLFQYRTKGENV